MTSFIRNHPSAMASGVSSVSTNLSATVPAGSTLVALLAHNADGGLTQTGMSKPGGESAAWVKVAENSTVYTTSTGTTFRAHAVWVIVTTIPWVSGQSVAGSFTGAAPVASLGLSEWLGISTTILAVDTESRDDDSGSTTMAVSTGHVLSADDAVVQCVALSFASYEAANESSAGTASASRTDLDWPSVNGFAAAPAIYVATSPGTRTLDYLSAFNSRALTIVALKATNYPPNAPTLTSMADGGTVNRGITQRASHTFSDPVASDSQSKFDLRYRLIGAPSWTTVTQTTPNQFYDFPAGALAAGNYERQVRTYDSVGVAGPYSTSGFFTAADAPAGPTITAPVNGETIIVPSDTFTWSAPDQDAYQVRKLADDTLSPGTPDTATVYYDSGEVIDTTTRTVQLDFPVNGRTEHLQVRVKDSGLWSEWASIVVDVDYAAPPVPVAELSIDIATGSLLVTITNPAPTGSDPAAIYNDIYVDDGSGEERRATGVSPNTSWRYWLPVSGRDYSTAVRVAAIAASGASRSSS